ncbi:Venom protein 55.1 [Armadillidium vulgare]|nr:Venom protein 55.1 [Armadillidium vulgare]
MIINYKIICNYKFVIPNANKRGIGIDLGLNRGYSGAQVAKALLGIEAANNPRGPGRRKRSLLNKENDTKSQTSEEDAKLWR